MWISWKSFQQKAALGKARAAELNNVVEGEKLHSDSGVFLDSHSLQENQPSKGKHSRLRSLARLHMLYNGTTDNVQAGHRTLSQAFIFSAGSKQDTRYINLPPQRQEEVEKLLSEGGSQSWRQLAGVLGYEQERADMFGRGEDPVHTLLTDWAQQDSSTLELLSTALSNIERHDVAKALSSTSQGITMVWIQFILTAWKMDPNEEKSTALCFCITGNDFTLPREEKNCILLVLYRYKCLFAALSTKSGCSAHLPFKTVSVFMRRGQSSFSKCWQAKAKHNTGFVIGKNPRPLFFIPHYSKRCHWVVQMALVTACGLHQKSRDAFQCCFPHSLVQEEERGLYEELLFLQKKKKKKNASSY